MPSSMTRSAGDGGGCHLHNGAMAERTRVAVLRASQGSGDAVEIGRGSLLHERFVLIDAEAAAVLTAESGFTVDGVRVEVLAQVEAPPLLFDITSESGETEQIASEGPLHVLKSGDAEPLYAVELARPAAANPPSGPERAAILRHPPGDIDPHGDTVACRWLGIYCDR
jgi:hypothetical protein